MALTKVNKGLVSLEANTEWDRKGSYRFKMLADTSNGSLGYSLQAGVTYDNEIVVWGDDVSSYIANGSASSAGFTTLPHPLAKIGTLVSNIYLVGKNLFILYADGDLYAKGYNFRGNMGIGNAAVQVDWVLSNTNVAKFISSNSGHHYAYQASYVIKPDASLWVCGANTRGQLGVGNNVEQHVWQEIVIGAETFADVVIADVEHASACLLTTSGKVYSTGYNVYGQLGIGSTIDSNTWQQVSTLSGHVVTSLDASGGTVNLIYYATVYALTDAGKMFAWGYNGHGQIGDGTIVQKNIPTEVVYTHDNVADPIRAMGVQQGCYGSPYYITTSNELYTWGYNAYGPVANVTVGTNSSTPVFALSNVQKVYQASGLSTTVFCTSFATLTTGDVFSWGSDLNGQLGTTGAALNNSTPTQIGFQDPTNIKQFSHMGNSSTVTMFALYNDGSLYAWGYNNTGALDGSGTINAAWHGTPMRIF